MGNKEIKNIGIIRADNGSIGEARTKAFLIDRFWILERSVDKDGADFIIQRKITEQNILDEVPPRFGIIQAKFSSNEKTCHYFDKDYVLNEEGRPYKELFLILNIGFENEQKICLLTAGDISSFNLNTDNKYVLPTKKILEQFQIKDNSLALDEIENSIQEAEFIKNRMLIFNELKVVKPDFNAMSSEFKYKIEYCDGNIAELFREYKEKAYIFIKKIEEIHAFLSKFIQETNPINSCYIAEEFIHRFDINLKIPEIFDKEFYYKLKNYIEQISSLKKDKILENYLGLPKQIENKVNQYLINQKQTLNKTTKLILVIKYYKTDFSNLTVNCMLGNTNNIDRYYKFTKLKEGEIELSINVGINVRNKNIVAQLNKYCLIEILQKIYELKYFEIE